MMQEGQEVQVLVAVSREGPRFESGVIAAVHAVPAGGARYTVLGEAGRVFRNVDASSMLTVVADASSDGVQA